MALTREWAQTWRHLRLWSKSQKKQVGGDQFIEGQSVCGWLSNVLKGEANGWISASFHGSHVTHLANAHWVPNKASARANCVVITVKKILTNP